MASKRKRRIDFRISAEDRERLEMISETYAVSLSGAIRMAIRVMLTQMGLQTKS